MRHRFAAVILVSIPAAWIVKLGDAFAIRKINSMSAADYIEYARHIHQRSYFVHLGAYIVLGGLYLCAIELLAYLLRRLTALCQRTQ